MKEWQFWIVTLISGAALVLVVVNMYLFLQNRSLQDEVNNRQVFINQSIQLEQLNKEIIGALANFAVKTNDQEIRQLLATLGITLSANPNPPAESGAQGQSKGRR